MDRNKSCKIFYNILNKYQYEYNNEYIRHKICNELSESLHIFVFDETTKEMEYESNQLFMVKINENYSIRLVDYIKNYDIYQRSKKIKKLKNYDN